MENAYNSNAYGSFASVYDIFMDNVPYEQWAGFLTELLKQYGVGDVKGNSSCDKSLASEEISQQNQKNIDNSLEENLSIERNSVLDLGCGTGTLTELLADAGFDMIGIDNSMEMLEIAREKQGSSGKDILYLLQDMREFELYGTVGAVVSVCDSLNYILEEEELEQVFSLVDNYLYPGGVFVFDFNTVYKYETVIGDATIAENREDCSFIWENYYHEDEQINEYDLTIFVRQDEKEELFARFSETHYQRGYTLETMKALVEKVGLQFVKAIDADTHQDVTKESERIYVIAKECKK